MNRVLFLRNESGLFDRGCPRDVLMGQEAGKRLVASLEVCNGSWYAWRIVLARGVARGYLDFREVLRLR